MSCIAYADGACTRNGQPDAKAGIGVWFGRNHPHNVSEPVRGPATNNNAEIQAGTRAIEEAIDMGYESIIIKTDSLFLINSATKWINKWRSNGWRTASNGPVKNKEAFLELEDAMDRMDHVHFEHVASHSGIEGNVQADKLAREGAKRY